MLYEVSIPDSESGGPPRTVQVEATNWRQALQSGLGQLGEDQVVRCMACDIQEDNTILVTDAASLRVFTLRHTDGPPSPASGEVEVGPPAGPQVTTDIPAPTANRRRLAETADIDLASEATLESVDPARFRKSVEMAIPARASARTSPDLEAVSFGAARVASGARQRGSKPRSRLTQEIGVGAMAPAKKPSIPTIGRGAARQARESPPKPRLTMSVKIARPGELKLVADNALEDVFLEIIALHDDYSSIDDASDFALGLAVEKIGAETAAVMFATPDGQELYFAAANGAKAQEVMSYRLPMGTGIAGLCTRDGVSILITDALEDDRFQEDLIASVGYECSSIICAPVQYEQRVYGCIELLNPTGREAFSAGDLNVLNYIGHQLGKFVQNVLFNED
jgi:hypothetical protein